ncbi:MAG: hypothetical protein RMJ19_10870 [Gemmatales bacterium]|nr:hypothetical protein [Gemmatales bacterium]MDW8176164.1 hypothetical protein [Gemmatales bacterium]
MRSLFELSTEEAWRLLAEHLRQDVPPLEAVQNEDWGRDYILQRLLQQPHETLHQLGIYIPTNLEQSHHPDGR